MKANILLISILISIICVFCLLSPLVLLFGAKFESWVVITETIGLLLLIGFFITGYILGGKK